MTIGFSGTNPSTENEIRLLEEKLKELRSSLSSPTIDLQIIQIQDFIRMLQSGDSSGLRTEEADRVAFFDEMDQEMRENPKKFILLPDGAKARHKPIGFNLDID